MSLYLVSQQFDSRSNGFRNAAVNGGLEIWQRGGGPFTADQSVAADHWTISRAGTTDSVTREAFVIGNVIPGYEPTYYMRSVVTSSAGASNYANFEHRIESVRTFAGQTVTASVWLKADATRSVSIELLQNFGAGGSPSASVTGIGATKLTVTTTWQRFTVTANLPSISGKTLGTTHDGSLKIIIWLDAGSTFNARTASLGQQSGTFDIWGLQLESGSVATPFERRSRGMELALCQRYFQRFSNPSAVIAPFATGVAWNTTNGQLTFPLATPMRAAPTLTISGAMAQWTTLCNNNVVPSTVTADQCTPTTGMINVSAPAASYVSGGGLLLRFAASSTATVDCSAEL